MAVCISCGPLRQDGTVFGVPVLVHADGCTVDEDAVRIVNIEADEVIAARAPAPPFDTRQTMGWEDGPSFRYGGFLELPR